MNVCMFYHSLVSDWNHGNAHFLRGVVRELRRRGHTVTVYEPRDGWSRQQLVANEGIESLERFRRAHPDLTSVCYDDALDLDEALDDADLVIVHEWNEPELVARIGAHRRRHRNYRLLFHDTHHRSVSAPDEMERLDLSGYDGVLAFGAVIRDIYVDRGWAEHVWVWHEAADVSVFRPRAVEHERMRDLVWVGNWGDDERAAQLEEFLVTPAKELALTGTVHGVRYPKAALDAVEDAGLEYGGWVANHRVPEVFASHLVTVHVPRRFYATHLPGIPTIRPFEALACGIPLITAPWEDCEGLFRPGVDYLVAKDGEQMREHLRAVLDDPVYARELATYGRDTIERRHTCAHRVDELLEICSELGVHDVDHRHPLPTTRLLAGTEAS